MLLPHSHGRTSRGINPQTPNSASGARPSTTTTPTAERAPGQETAVEFIEVNGSTSSSSATATSIKKEKMKKDKKEWDKRADKMDHRRNGLRGTRGAKDQENRVREPLEI